MARTAIAITATGYDAPTAPAPTAIDPTNDMYIDLKSNAQGLLLIVTVTTGGTMTIKAGDLDPKTRNFLGDKSYTLANSTVYYITIEGMRYMTNPFTNGSDTIVGGIKIDFSAPVVGTIEAVRLDKRTFF